MISTQTIILLGIVLALSIFGPVVLAIIWKKTAKSSIVPLFCGAATFVVFAMILEAIPKAIITGNTNLFSAIQKIPFLFSLVFGLLAGVFEEVGRFVVMKFLMKKHRDNKDAIMFGIGHGGIECILVLGLTYVNNIAYAVAVNQGVFTVEALHGVLTQNQIDIIIQGLQSLTPLALSMAVFERVFAILLHITWSMLIMYAVKEKKNYILLICILAHAFIDTITGYLSLMGVSVVIIELCIAVCSIGCFMVVRNFVGKKE